MGTTIDSTFLKVLYQGHIIFVEVSNFPGGRISVSSDSKSLQSVKARWLSGQFQQNLVYTSSDLQLIQRQILIVTSAHVVIGQISHEYFLLQNHLLKEWTPMDQSLIPALY